MWQSFGGPTAADNYQSSSFWPPVSLRGQLQLCLLPRRQHHLKRDHNRDLDFDDWENPELLNSRQLLRGSVPSLMSEVRPKLSRTSAVLVASGCLGGQSVQPTILVQLEMPATKSVHGDVAFSRRGMPVVPKGASSVSGLTSRVDLSMTARIVLGVGCCQPGPAPACRRHI